MLRRLLAGCALAAAFAATSLGASAQYYGPRVPPPPARYEHHGAPPGAGYVWVGGYHRWNGHAYVWVGGQWRRPPHMGYVWRAGHWADRHGTYVWIPGHWVPG